MVHFAEMGLIVEESNKNSHSVNSCGLIINQIVEVEDYEITVLICAIEVNPDNIKVTPNSSDPIELEYHDPTLFDRLDNIVKLDETRAKDEILWGERVDY